MIYFICTYICVNACVREFVEDGITNDGEPPDMGAGDQALLKHLALTADGAFFPMPVRKVR